MSKLTSGKVNHFNEWLSWFKADKKNRIGAEREPLCQQVSKKRKK